MKSIDELLESEGIIPERPPSLDAKGRRLDIFPAKVKGKYRTGRNIVYTLLLILFLVIPWTKFAGEQTILLNLSEKKFTFFGLTFLAHDGPLVFFVFGFVIFSLLLATALYGRVWCGWACPQTVFIDGVFRKIEELVEGNHIKRKKLSESPLNKQKIFKKTLKWIIFLVVSSHIAHSIVAYFFGAQSLFWTTMSLPNENWSMFIFVQVFTLLIALNFGWFKEQFCLVACPYGRFQSVLMDQRSKTVIYDYKRGEPRREKKSNDFADCVNCFKCVTVCPTGIDIRDGQQLECIGCTSCIDACDVVMEKIGKPKGLIRYASEEEIETGVKNKSKLNMRAVFYSLGLALFTGLLSTSVYLRETVSVKVIRAVDSPYKVMTTSSGEIVSNHFRIHLTNQSNKEIKLSSLKVSDLDVEVVAPGILTHLEPGQRFWLHVFLKVPLKKLKQGEYKTNWSLLFKDEGVKEKTGVFKILGPMK